MREEKEREMEERGKMVRWRRSGVSDEESGRREEDAEDVTWVIANAVAGITVEKPESSPNKTVWGTPRVDSIPSTSTAIPQILEEEDDEGGLWTQNWEKKLNTESHSSSKRKKGKKVLLMSNSVKRGI